MADSVDLFGIPCPGCDELDCLDHEGDGERVDKLWCETCGWEGKCHDVMSEIENVDEYKDHLAGWVLSRWRAEVENRPIVNIHRRTLDGTWRQIYRKITGEEIAAPTHEQLLNTCKGGKGEG
jgi:hypothetical protein